MPVATMMRRVSWRPHPLSVLYSNREGGPKYEDYNPRPKPLNSRRVTELLSRLPKLEHAESIVTGCRLYALALELVQERPDISYQLLISSVVWQMQHSTSSNPTKLPKWSIRNRFSIWR